MADRRLAGRLRRATDQKAFTTAKGARALAGLGAGDGPPSVRVRPSSLKRDCDCRTTSTCEKCLINVHAKSRLTLEPLRTLRSETKGQAEACPDAGHPLHGAGGHAPRSPCH